MRTYEHESIEWSDAVKKWVEKYSELSRSERGTSEKESTTLQTHVVILLTSKIDT